MAPKKQVQKMSLGDFLGDQSMGSWADEMEDMPIPSDSRTGYGERRAFSSYAPSMGSGFDRGPPREQLPLPSKPPFTAHLGNLPYDATSVDVEEFFNGCSVKSVRLVEDRAEGRPKGFGYVEFGTLEGLTKALDLNNAQFRGRNIKVSVADPPKDRGEVREITDWSRKGPLPDLPQQQRRASERNFGDGMRRGYDAPDMERGGSRRGNMGMGMGEGDGKSRDFSNWERKGPLSPVPGQDPSNRGPGRVRGPPEGEERRNVASWGEGRSQEGSRTRPEIRDRPPPPERKPTAAEQDTQWRAKMRPDPPAKSSTPTPDPSTPSSPAAVPALSVRPKLNLAKRTVSEAHSPATPDPGSVDAKSSPFGAARPIDTAAREKEIEEKRLAAIEEKRAAEEKAREEKKAQEAAAKEAAAKEAAEKAAKGEEKEEAVNGAEETEAGKVTVLSRPKDNEDAAKPKEQGPNGSSERPAPTHHRSRGPPREGREPREQRGPREPREQREPREPRENKDGNQPPRGPRNAGQREWRKPSNSGPPGKESTPASPPTPSAGPDDDGWSTVPAKQKGGPKGRGNNTSRAPAS